MKRLVFLSILTICAYGAMAQPGDLGTEEITVVKEYDPTLSDVVKLQYFPSLKNTNPEPLNLQYSIRPLEYETRFTPEPIAPARISRTKLDKLYKNYLEVGFGNYTTPYVHFSHSSRRNRNWSGGVYVRHLSSQGGIKDYAFNGFAQNNVGVFGHRYYSGLNMGGRLYYDHDRIHYYGNVAEDIEKDSIRQDFHTVGAEFELKSSKDRDEVVFDCVEVKYMRFFDAADGAENNLQFLAEISTPVREVLFRLDVDARYLNTAFDTLAQDYFIFGIRPRIESQYGDLHFTLGIHAYLTGDLTAESTRANLFPQIDVTYNVVDDILIAYGGWDGRLMPNSYRSLTEQNPFITDYFQPEITVQKGRIFAGLKGALSSQASFNVKAQFASYSDYVLFYNNPYSPVVGDLDTNKFKIIYDEMGVFTVAGEVFFQTGDKFTAGLRGAFNSYSPENFAAAWNLPSLQLTALGKYLIGDKIYVDLEAFLVGERQVLPANLAGVPNDREVLPAYVDVNLGLEYRYSELLSAFLRLNNLTGSKYELWLYYPAQRFNVLGGFTYRF